MDTEKAKALAERVFSEVIPPDVHEVAEALLDALERVGELESSQKIRPVWVEIPTEKNKRTRERTQLAGKRLLLGLFHGKSADIVVASGFWNETDCYWEWLGVPDTPTHYMSFPPPPDTDIAKKID